MYREGPKARDNCGGVWQNGLHEGHETGMYAMAHASITCVQEKSSVKIHHGL